MFPSRGHHESVKTAGAFATTTFNFRSALLYATVFLSSGLSVLMFAAVSLTEKLVVRW